MAFEPSISFIGSGNLAWHLAPAFDNAGYSVKEVYSRDAKHAESLADQLYEAEVKDTLDFSGSNSRIFVLAVADNAIADVAREIVLPDQSLLIHTSGSVAIDALSFAAPTAAGVFYPLQLFTKNRKADFKNLPIFMEGTERDAEEVLFEMGRALGGNIQKLSGEKRLALHLTATIASTFSNHMLEIAHELSVENEIKWDWFKPLIRETIDKSLSIGAPAHRTQRINEEIAEKHVEYLKEDEKLAELYRIISNHIMGGKQIE